MRLRDVTTTRLLAKQLIKRCERVLLDAQNRAADDDVKPSKHSGALRRCSMEMTRHLAVLRRGK